MYLAKALNTLYNDEGIKADPKHFEFLAKTQFNYVKADTRLGEYLPGEVIPYNEAKKLLKDRGSSESIGKSHGKVLMEPTLQHMPGTRINKAMQQDFRSAGIDKVKVADEPIKFSPVAASAIRTPLFNPNWMQRLGYRYQKATLIDAATSGEIADVHSYNPIPGIVTGEIGRGIDGKY